jgi:hypothetical protein
VAPPLDFQYLDATSSVSEFSKTDQQVRTLLEQVIELRLTALYGSGSCVGGILVKQLQHIPSDCGCT